MKKEKTAFDLIVPNVEIKTERLTVTEITERDKNVYAELYKDDAVNEYYGYDYREDLNGRKPTADYFYEFFCELKDKKEEYSLAVRLNGEMIGEIVLYNFSVLPEKVAEIGFRFFKERQKRGYAAESVSATIEYMKCAGFSAVKSKCLKPNFPSYKLIERLGFDLKSEDEKYYYFEKEL